MTLVQAVVQAAVLAPSCQVIDLTGLVQVVQVVQANTSIMHTRTRARTRVCMSVNAWTAWTSLISLRFSRCLPGPCLDHCLDQRTELQQYCALIVCYEIMFRRVGKIFGSTFGRFGRSPGCRVAGENPGATGCCGVVPAPGRRLRSFAA
jgi:hypothetical protein